MQLRYYQQEAVDAVWLALRSRADNPCVVLPTGSGKTPLLATIIREAVGRWNGKVLVLTHVKELIEQQRDTLNQWAPELHLGINSAGLKLRHTDHPVILAGIQSVYKNALDFGERNLVLVDEAHLLPPDGEGMYQRFLTELKEANPRVRVVGLTATPYRTSTGKICTEASILNHVCYEAPIGELIKAGFLCPVVTQSTTQVDMSSCTIRRGEYVQSIMEDLFSADEALGPACEELAELSAGRQSVLVFTAGVDHGKKVTDRLNDLGMDAGFLCGDTLPLERANLIERFKSGDLRTLVNVNVLTTGFDATRVDCIGVMRATCSPGLFYQMCGRGFRLNEGKEDCLVLDFGGNISRHGPLDSPDYGAIREKKGGGAVPLKMCPNCKEFVPAGIGECPHCNHLFEISREGKHGVKADNKKLLTHDEMYPAPQWVSVGEIHMSEHTKKGAKDGDPKTLRVDYYPDQECGNLERARAFSEWVCLEHPMGFAREKACNWWLLRSHAPVPSTIQQALALWRGGALADVPRVKVAVDRKNPKYKRVVEAEIGSLPETWEAQYDEWAEDETPF